MADLILREAALDVLVTSPNFHTTLTRIEELPAVDAAPVVHARWQGVSPMVDSEECSACRYCIPSEEFRTLHCPWCGAKMDGKRRDDDAFD